MFHSYNTMAFVIYYKENSNTREGSFFFLLCIQSERTLLHLSKFILVQCLHISYEIFFTWSESYFSDRGATITPLDVLEPGTSLTFQLRDPWGYDSKKELQNTSKGFTRKGGIGKNKGISECRTLIDLPIIKFIFGEF